MHCQAIVFGENPARLMESLIRTAQGLDHVSVPLDVADAGGRSGWHIIGSEHRQLPDQSAYGYGNWVHCVWPTAFLREHLGPHALLSDEMLTALEVPRDQVQKKDGQWWAKVPRYFRTIGVQWSIVYRSSRWQGHGSRDAADGATVSSLDLEHNLTAHDPNLIVGPTGPVFYQDPEVEGRNVVRRRLEATLPLMRLPPSTPVNLATWHDKEPQRYGWSGTGDEPCSCFGKEYEHQRWSHPGYGY